MALLGLLFPTPVAAQAAEACGADVTLLMHCTFNDGAKQVAVCHDDGIISYQFGPNFSDLELSLTSNFADLDYAPYGWASNTIYESVIFQNGNTTYEVFASIPRRPNPGPAEGGINVTRPDQSRLSLTCDPGSISPNNPLDGIGQLTALAPGHEYMLLRDCLDDVEDPQSCVGRVRAAVLKQNRCVLGPDQTDCWTTEAAAWDFLLNNEITSALNVVASLRGDAYAKDLSAAQDTWETTRRFDCDLIFMLPFTGDGGAAACNVEYASRRLQFLKGVVSMAEFDG